MAAKLAGVIMGATAGLMTLASVASATEGHDGPGSEGRTCTTTAGEASATSDISGDSLANTVSQAPVAGSTAGNIACSDVLSNNDHNFSGNFNDNDDNRFG